MKILGYDRLSIEKCCFLSVSRATKLTALVIITMNVQKCCSSQDKSYLKTVFEKWKLADLSNFDEKDVRIYFVTLRCGDPFS